MRELSYELNSRDLDNYITGHYGEDQFRCGDCGGFHEEPDEGECLDCGHDHDVKGGDRSRGDYTEAVPGHSDICDCLTPRFASCPESHVPDYESEAESRAEIRTEKGTGE